MKNVSIRLLNIKSTSLCRAIFGKRSYNHEACDIFFSCAGIF